MMHRFAAVNGTPLASCEENFLCELIRVEMVLRVGLWEGRCWAVRRLIFASSEYFDSQTGDVMVHFERMESRAGSYLKVLVVDC